MGEDSATESRNHVHSVRWSQQFRLLVLACRHRPCRASRGHLNRIRLQMDSCDTAHCAAVACPRSV